MAKLDSDRILGCLCRFNLSCRKRVKSDNRLDMNIKASSELEMTSEYRFQNPSPTVGAELSPQNLPQGMP